MYPILKQVSFIYLKLYHQLNKKWISHLKKKNKYKVLLQDINQRDIVSTKTPNIIEREVYCYVNIIIVQILNTVLKLFI